MPETSSATYYRTIIDAIRDPVVVLNLDLTCDFINKAAQDLFEIDGDSYHVRPCFDLIRHFEQPCSERGEVCPVQEAMESGEMVRTIKELSLFSGLKRLYEITAVPLMDETGRMRHVFEVLRDITASHDHMKLKELTAQIEQAKREWEATIDCVQDFVILLDGQGRIRRLNRPMVDFSSLPFAKILGQEFSHFLAAQNIEKGVDLKDSSDSEYVHTSSGRTFSMHTYALLTSQEEMQVVTLHDITQRKFAARQLEEKNREIEKAFAELKATQSQLLQQEKMASVGQLAAGVAHEINNPIGFVTSNINSLAKYLDKIKEFIEIQNKFVKEYCPDEDKVKTLQEYGRKLKIDFIIEDTTDLISESLDGVERVKKIVMNLKNFSRVDQAVRSAVNINDCLEDTINIAWNELKYKCTLDKEYSDLPPITCYPQQLNQVFMNILVNAAQAMADPGIITIKTWFADKAIFIAISDTGCGIAPDKIPHVFDPFYTTKAVGQGTGLGLSISYDIIVKQHHGTIRINSEVGKGTTFTICLPLPTQEERP